MAEERLYTYSMTARTPRPRSKRLRETGQASGSMTVVTGGTTITTSGSSTTGSGHTHRNKTDLDRIATTADGYITLDTPTDDGTTAEKVRAGYADEAGHADEASHATTADAAATAGYAEEAGHAATAYDLDSDSPAYDKFLRKDVDDTAAGNLTFNQNLEVKGRITTADIQNIGTFVEGLLGEGWRVWMADGRAHAAVDFLTVRQRQTVLELLIDKVRATGGMLIVSPAAAKIDTVTLNAAGTEYHIAFETDTADTALNRSGGFVAHDLIRCSTWAKRAPDGTAGDTIRHYWVEVLAADESGITVLKTQFPYATEPAAGDECVLMGNTDDDSGRQSFIEIAATDDGTPRISVYDGVCRTALTDAAGRSCLRARLGCLNDISDPDFSNPAVAGYGLYSDNAYLKGDFVLTTGERIATRLKVLEGQIKSTVEAAREDLTELSYLSNCDFAAQLDYWHSYNTSVFYATGAGSNLRLILTGGTLLANGLNKTGADIQTDESRTVCRIRNSYILQRAADFRFRPDFDTDETDATLRVAKPVYLTLYVKALTAGHMTVEIENSDPTGFTPFTPFRAEVDLTATDGYVKYDFEGFWNGTGDFRLTYTGAAYFHTLILSTDRAQVFAARYQTVLEQTATFLRAAALEYDENGQITSAAGLMLTSQFAGMFASAVDNNGIVKQADISTFITETQAGELISNATINADQINLHGYTTINGNFHIDEEGNMVAKSGVFEGRLQTLFADLSDMTAWHITKADIGESVIDYEGMYRITDHFNLRMNGEHLILPVYKTATVEDTGGSTSFYEVIFGGDTTSHIGTRVSIWGKGTVYIDNQVQFPNMKALYYLREANQDGSDTGVRTVEACNVEPISITFSGLIEFLCVPATGVSGVTSDTISCAWAVTTIRCEYCYADYDENSQRVRNIL